MARVLPLLHVPIVIAGVHLVVSTYALMLLVAACAGFAVFARRCPPTLPASSAAGVLAAAALAGARVTAIVLHEMDGAALAGRGLSSSGAIVGGVLAACVLGRASGTHVLGAVAPAALVAGATGRLGCFLAGCCQGRPTDLPWGVIFPEFGPPARHPVQLYEAGGDFLLAGVAGIARTPDGAVRRAAIGYGLLRAGLETVRDPATTDRLLGGWLPLAPTVALLMALAAMGGATVRRPAA